MNFGFQMKLTDIKDHFEMITELPEGASDSKIQNKRLNCLYLYYWYAPRVPRGSTDLGKPTEFEFQGYRCNHEALEPLDTKNLSKMGIFHEFRLFSRGFWHL